MQSKWIPRCSLFILFVLASVFLARFCHYQTQGFALSKIRDNFPLEEIAGVPREAPSFCNEKIFGKKFFFFGRGQQSFAFLSEDGNYVLKLFNNKDQRMLRLIAILSHLPVAQDWTLTQKIKLETKLYQAFSSYELAFDEMADKTALLYLHTAPSMHLPKTLTLVDASGICHTIDPNQIAFLLQRKVTLAYPALEHWISSQKLEEAKKALSSLIDLFFWKWEHHILDSDPLIRTNYGFINTKAIQIDVGPLSKQIKQQDRALFCKEIRRITASLKEWLGKTAPELVPYIEQELEHHLDQQLGDPLSSEE